MRTRAAMASAVIGALVVLSGLTVNDGRYGGATPAWAQSPLPTPSASSSQRPTLPPATASPTPTPEEPSFAPEPSPSFVEPTPSPTRRRSRPRTTSPQPPPPRPAAPPPLTVGPESTWTPADEVVEPSPAAVAGRRVAAGSTDRVRYYGVLVLGLAVVLGIGGVAGLLLTREPRSR